jgi:hypothetical protein
METELRLRLEDEIAAALRQASECPAAWGTDDCALWCADAIRRALGYDPAEDVRGYSDRDGAMSAVGVLGLGYALRRTARQNGWRRIDPTQALPGDIGVARVPDGAGIFWPVTMICRCPGWFVSRASFGFRGVPATAVRIAWAIL